MASKLETDPVIMINERNSQTTTREKYILLKLKKKTEKSTYIYLKRKAYKLASSKLSS